MDNPVDDIEAARRAVAELPKVRPRLRFIVGETPDDVSIQAGYPQGATLASVLDCCGNWMWTNGLLQTLLAIERGEVDGENIASNADIFWVFRDGAVGGYTHAGDSGFEGFAHEFEDVRRAFHDAQDAWLWPYRVAVRDLERRSDQPGARELFETEPELKGLLAGLKRDAELRATAEDRLSAVRSGRSSCEVLTDDDHALYIFAGGAAFNLQKPTPEWYVAAPPTKVCALRLHDVLEAFDRELP